MFISVVICTRNRAASLRRTLESLFSPGNLATPDWELVLVDNDSTDSTQQVCQEFQEQFGPRFRCALEKTKGKCNALNTGLAAAKGDLLAMTDDDVLCAPDYLQAIRAVCSQYPAHGVQGRILLDCEGGRPAWLDDYFAAFLAWRDYGDQVLEFSENLCGSNMIIRADVVKQIGGYSPELGPGAAGFGDDAEFSLRMRRAGFNCIYAPQIMVWHKIPPERLTKRFFHARFFRHGCSLAYFEPLPAPIWRFSLYTAKQWMKREAEALWHRLAGHESLAVRRQCEALSEFGFFWQHLLMRLGLAPQPSATKASFSSK